MQKAMNNFVLNIRTCPNSILGLVPYRFRHRPRAVQAWAAAGVAAGGRWTMDSAAEFHAYEVRRTGAFAGLSARRGAPRR